MKDIEFRVYDKKTKQMVTEENVYKIIDDYEENGKVEVFGPYYKYERYPTYKILVILRYLKEDIIDEIDEDTNEPRFEIMQYTGLKDKNGKKIFEGDIVKAKYIEKRDFAGVKYENKMEFVELVVWKEQSFQLEIDNEGIKMYRHLNFYENINNIKLKEVEVVGNIFDNKEILEANNE